MKRRGQRMTTTRPEGIKNHLNRDFNAPDLGTKCVTDITEIQTAEGKLFLCAVLDLFSKLVISWSTHHRQVRQTVTRDVEMAEWQRQQEVPVILHAD